MRPTIDETCLNVAVEWSRRSTCLRRAVGCVLTNARGHVLSTGYNGRARGQEHCNYATSMKFMTAPALYEELKLLESRGVFAKKKFFPPDNDSDPELLIYPQACKAAGAASGTQLDGCEAIHAEQNSLLQCRDVWAIDTCYVTHSPCITCVKLLLNTSCKRIVFIERYAHDQEAMRLWLPATLDKEEPNAGHEWVHLAR